MRSILIYFSENIYCNRIRNLFNIKWSNWFHCGCVGDCNFFFGFTSETWRCFHVMKNKNTHIYGTGFRRQLHFWWPSLVCLHHIRTSQFSKILFHSTNLMECIIFAALMTTILIIKLVIIFTVQCEENIQFKWSRDSWPQLKQLIDNNNSLNVQIEFYREFFGIEKCH